MLDLKIVGGTVVDGTGQSAFRADVGVRDGRVVAVGDVAEDARQTVDATGKIVSPGFIDVHTHYDVQVFWDPKLSPSCFHGVTTVLAGLCGFSIAPLSAEAAGYIRPMLARVEGMPLETLEVALTWDWTSFGDYLGRLDGRIGLNAGFFAGHSAIRRVVMGERAVGERATPDELEAMKTLLAQSLEQGALGFSTTISTTHNDGDGNPLVAGIDDRLSRGIRQWNPRCELVWISTDASRFVRRSSGDGSDHSVLVVGCVSGCCADECLARQRHPVGISNS